MRSPDKLVGLPYFFSVFGISIFETVMGTTVAPAGAGVITIVSGTGWSGGAVRRRRAARRKRARRPRVRVPGGQVAILGDGPGGVRGRARRAGEQRVSESPPPSPPASTILTSSWDLTYVSSMSHSSPRTQRSADSLPLIMPHSKSSQGPRFFLPYSSSVLRAAFSAPFHTLR